MDTTNWTAPELENLRSEKRFNEYVREHPMPKNTVYDSVAQMRMSILKSTGALTLAIDTEDTMIQYLEDLIGFMQ